MLDILPRMGGIWYRRVRGVVGVEVIVAWGTVELSTGKNS
jgi:hypothetical protein